MLNKVKRENNWKEHPFVAVKLCEDGSGQQRYRFFYSQAH